MRTGVNCAALTSAAALMEYSGGHRRTILHVGRKILYEVSRVVQMTLSEVTEVDLLDKCWWKEDNGCSKIVAGWEGSCFKVK